ncbi:MAG TPA: TlpA disulfide reductase family protein [Flavisolibacter sp.]|nr:TlpA disulfide reductase family protein [Flavisolibacter sp.]
MRFFIITIVIVLCVSCQYNSSNKKSLESLTSSNDIVVVNFWSIFCTPCLKELPELNKVYNQYKGSKKISIVAVALNSKAEISQFLSGDTTNILGRIYKRSNYELTLPIIPLYEYDSQINYSTLSVGNNFKNKAKIDSIKREYKLQGTPTTIIFYKGKEVGRIVGFPTSSDYNTKLTEYIEKLLISR